MKKNKIFMFGTAALVGMLMTGCQKSNSSSRVSSGSGSASVSKTNNVDKDKPRQTTHQTGNLSPNDLSPKETVAVVTAYASKKYGDSWSDLRKDAIKTNLEVDFLNRDKYPKIDKGQGYIYDVGSKDYTFKTRYTLEGDGSSQVIYFYEGNDYLGSSTISDIVAYLNKTDSDELVSELEDGAVIGGESSESDDSNSSSDSDSNKDSDSKDDSKSDSDLPGDAGEYTTPGNMRGSWYSSDGEISVGTHSISTGDGDMELHKQKSDFKSAGLDPDKYSKYGVATTTNVSGMQAISFSPWTQATGSHEIYAYTTAKGQPVMLDLTSTGSLNGVYWKSKSAAEKYKGKTFDSLNDFNDWK